MNCKCGSMSCTCGWTNRGYQRYQPDEPNDSNNNAITFRFNDMTLEQLLKVHEVLGFTGIHVRNGTPFLDVIAAIKERVKLPDLSPELAARLRRVLSDG